MKDCCRDNLGDPQPLANDLVVRVCQTCGAKHYELTVDTGDAVSEGAEV